MSTSIGNSIQYVTSSDADPDDFHTTGVYYFSTCSYAPIGTNGWLVVFNPTGGETSAHKQIWYRLGTADSNDWETCVRTYAGGTWSTWRSYTVASTGSAVGSSSTPVYVNSAGVLTSTGVDLDSTAQLNRLTSGTFNCNSYTDLGIYYCSANVSITNGPSDANSSMGNGWIISLPDGASTNVKQIAMRLGTIDVTDFMVWTRTKISGTWSTWRRLLSAMMVRAGTVTITPSAANTPTGKDVTFATAMAETPKSVQLTPITAVPGTTVTGVGVQSLDSTGFTAYLTRTTVVATGLSYIAICNTGESY